MKRLVFFAFLVPSLSFALPVKDSEVSFAGKAKILGSTVNIDGAEAKLKGEADVTDGKLSGKFYVTVAEFKTGMDLRDKHFQETIKAKEVSMILDPVEMKGTQRFKGVMTIGEKSAPVEGEMIFAGAKVEAKMKVKMTSFGLVPVDYKAAKVEDEVDVKASFSL